MSQNSTLLLFSAKGSKYHSTNILSGFYIRSLFYCETSTLNMWLTLFNHDTYIVFKIVFRPITELYIQNYHRSYFDSRAKMNSMFAAPHRARCFPLSVRACAVCRSHPATSQLNSSYSVWIVYICVACTTSKRRMPRSRR